MSVYRPPGARSHAEHVINNTMHIEVRFGREAGSGRREIIGPPLGRVSPRGCPGACRPRRVAGRRRHPSFAPCRAGRARSTPTHHALFLVSLLLCRFRPQRPPFLVGAVGSPPSPASRGARARCLRVSSGPPVRRGTASLAGGEPYEITSRHSGGGKEPWRLKGKACAPRPLFVSGLFFFPVLRRRRRLRIPPLPPGALPPHPFTSLYPLRRRRLGPPLPAPSPPVSIPP